MSRTSLDCIIVKPYLQFASLMLVCELIEMEQMNSDWVIHISPSSGGFRYSVRSQWFSKLDLRSKNFLTRMFLPSCSDISNYSSLESSSLMQETSTIPSLWPSLSAWPAVPWNNVGKQFSLGVLHVCASSDKASTAYFQSILKGWLHSKLPLKIETISPSK